MGEWLWLLLSNVSVLTRFGEGAAEETSEYSEGERLCSCNCDWLQSICRGRRASCGPSDTFRECRPPGGEENWCWLKEGEWFAEPGCWCMSGPRRWGGVGLWFAWAIMPAS